jgi:hypothetical protein
VTKAEMPDICLMRWRRWACQAGASVLRPKLSRVCSAPPLARDAPDHIANIVRHQKGAIRTNQKEGVSILRAEQNTNVAPYRCPVYRALHILTRPSDGIARAWAMVVRHGADPTWTWVVKSYAACKRIRQPDSPPNAAIPLRLR